jgi:putative PIG3 family NAD(P)H quinone oxidoreductase
VNADMTAIEIVEPGPEGRLRAARVAIPTPGPGEVLIQVAAAGVNRVDVLQRLGRYTPPPGVTAIAGVEVAGRVAAIGADASRFAIGDKVCALIVGGGYAEYAAAPERQVLPVPTGYSFREAAALPEAFCTVWAAMYGQGRLAHGETLLIHGGASGIGSTAIMLARALGAGPIFTTAGSAEKCRVCEQLGASRAINYKTENFADIVRAEANGQGVDVIIDMVGGDYVEKNLALLADDGRLVFIGVMSRIREAAFNAVDVMFRRLVITGVSLRGQSVARKAEIVRAVETYAWPLLERRAIAPVIDSVYPFTEAEAAHRRLEALAHTGKLILEMPSFA